MVAARGGKCGSSAHQKGAGEKRRCTYRVYTEYEMPSTTYGLYPAAVESPYTFAPAKLRVSIAALFVTTRWPGSFVSLGMFTCNVLRCHKKRKW